MAFSIKIDALKKNLIFLTLFLASMNFKAKFFYFVFIAFLILVVFQNGLKICKSSYIYLMLGIIMSIFNINEGILSMIRCVAPFCFFLVGFNIVFESNDNCCCFKPEKNLYSIITIISLGSFSHFTVNFFYNIGEHLGRNTIDVWSGEKMAATGQVALASLMIGFSISLLLFPPLKYCRLLSLVVLSVMFLYNRILLSRTLLVVLAIDLLIGVIYCRKEIKNKLSSRKSVLCVVSIIVLCCFIYLNTNIRGMIFNSALIQRFNGTLNSLIDNSERTTAKLLFLSDMIKYPFGGLHMRAKYGYAHDLLLDGYDEYGIIILIILIAIIVCGIIDLIRFLRNKAFSKYIKMALLLVYTTVLLEFLQEPIIEGMPWLLSCYCLLNGGMCGMNRLGYRNDLRHKNESVTD